MIVMSTIDNDPIRIPGLYRSWELGQILRPGHDYRLEAAGQTEDGAGLIMVFMHPARSSAGGGA